MTYYVQPRVVHKPLIRLLARFDIGLKPFHKNRTGSDDCHRSFSSDHGWVWSWYWQYGRTGHLVRDNGLFHHVFNSERSYQHICDLGHYCQGGIKRPCPAGTFGGELGLDSPLCSGPCEKGYFCPSASVSQTAFKCSDALGRTRDAQTFFANTLRNVDKRCLVHLLDVYPEQFFEFSLLNPNQERDPSLWELAHDKAGLYSVYNTMQWDQTNWAFASHGDPVEYMATGWRPGPGPKTMCMWKKFLTDDIYGLDGMQKQESTNDYFMLGTLWSFRDRVFASSGTNRGTYAQTPVSILKDEWVNHRSAYFH